MKKLLRSPVARPVIVLVALALAVALTAAAGGLGRVDLSPHRAATLSAEALAAVRAVNEPVRVVLIETDASNNVWLDEIVRRMDAASPNITGEIVAPDSQRLEALAALADGQALSDGSVLVASEKRAVVLSAADLYSYDIDQMTYYYTGAVSYTRADFTAQDALCRALKYVSRDDMPVLYALEGHGETGWDGALNRLCFENAVELRRLSLAPGEPVPEDADALLLCGPASPVGEETAAALLDYLKAGGDMVLMTSHTTDFTGLDDLVGYYGMARKTGLVVEGDQNRVYDADHKYYLIPELRANPVTDALIESRQSVLMIVSEAIVRSDVRRAGLNAQPILLTSDQAYLKLNPSALTTLEQTPEDESGRFTLGMAAVEGDTHLVWLAASTMMSEANDTGSGGGNSALFAEILRQMMEFPRPDEALPSVSLLTVPASIPAAPALAALIAPPLICLAVGLALRRRRGA